MSKYIKYYHFSEGMKNIFYRIYCSVVLWLENNKIIVILKFTIFARMFVYIFDVKTVMTLMTTRQLSNIRSAPNS